MRIVLKCVFLAMCVFVWNVCDKFVLPLVGNLMAMEQMNHSIDSTLWIQVYSYYNKYSYLALILFALLLFGEELKNIFNTKEKRNEEI